MIRSILLTLFFALCSAPILAATFTVDSTADTSDPGTLRWAIEQHNASGTSNLIVFDASLAGQEIDVENVVASINFNSLTIDGSGAPELALVSSRGRILNVDNSVVFTLRNLTLRDSDGVFGGGCIRATTSEAIITVENVTFTNCSQASVNTFDGLGGAIRFESDLGGNGRLTVRNSRFIGNRIRGSANLVLGGAIYANGGTVILDGNRFELNDAVNEGNAFHQGGAVFIESADVEIFDNEFLFNQADGGAGGALALNLRPSNSAFIIGNLFAGNLGRLGAGVWTGTQVISGDVPFFNFTHNTFLANTSDASTGAAMFLREGDVILRNNSWVDNVNLGGGAAHLAFNPSRTDFLGVWNNLFGPSGTDFCGTTSGSPGPFAAAGYNLRPDASCEFNGSIDVVTSAADFLPLADYGGATRTVPPAFGNPALDAANPMAPGGGNVALCLETDVRGLPRPGDADGDGLARCDIGAFEWQGETPFFADGFEETGLVIP